MSIIAYMSGRTQATIQIAFAGAISATSDQVTLPDGSNFLVGDWIFIPEGAGSAISGQAITVGGGYYHKITAISGGPVNAVATVSPPVTASTNAGGTPTGTTTYTPQVTVAKRTTNFTLSGSKTIKRRVITGKPITGGHGQHVARLYDAADGGGNLINVFDQDYSLEAGEDPELLDEAIALPAGTYSIVQESKGSNAEGAITNDYGSLANSLKLLES